MGNSDRVKGLTRPRRRKVLIAAAVVFLVVGALVVVGYLRHRTWQRSVPGLLWTLRVRAGNADACYEASKRLATAPTARKYVPLLAEALDGEDTYVRYSAMRALSNLGPDAKAAVPSIIRSLKSPGTQVRVLAAETLGKIGPEARGIIPALAGALGDSAPDVRRCAAERLGYMGPAAREAAPALERAISDRNLTVAIEAAEALWKVAGKSGDPKKVLPALTRALRSWGLWASAVRLLGRMGSDAKEAAPEIALLLVPGKGAPVYGEGPRFEATSVALRQIGPSAVPVLIKALAADADSDWCCRYYRKALDIIGPATEEEVPELQKLLRHENEHVRKAAAETLKKIRRGE